MLPTILHCIRAVWKYSRFYNTPHHIVGLLRKVGPQLLKRQRLASCYILCQHCHGRQHSLTASKQAEQPAPSAHYAALLWLSHSSPTTHHRSLRDQLVCVLACR